ncbi:MAG: flippase [Candidatus Diapherotrites archaeon]
MSTAKRIVKNTFFMLAGNFVSLAISFILLIIIARELGAAAFGVYSFIFAFLGYFYIISDFGMNNYIIREIAREKEKPRELFGEILGAKIVLSLLSFVLLSISFTIVGGAYSPLLMLLLYLAALSTLATTVIQLVTYSMQGFEDMLSGQKITILNKVLIFSFTIAALFYGLKLEGIVLAYVAATFITALAAFAFFSRKYFFQRPLMHPGRWKELIIAAIPFGILWFFLTVYFNTGIVFLSFLKGDVSAGIYSAAYRIIYALSFLPMALTASIFPAVSKAHILSKETVKSICEKSVKNPSRDFGAAFCRRHAVGRPHNTPVLFKRVCCFLCCSKATHICGNLHVYPAWLGFDINGFNRE